MKSIQVYVAAPAWVYKDNGESLEHSLSIEFLSDSDFGAVEEAIKWALERHEAIMKDYGGGAFFSSIKVYTKAISEPDDTGYIRTVTTGQLFEWKYDWPGTIEQYVEAAKSRGLSSIRHTRSWLEGGF